MSVLGMAKYLCSVRRGSGVVSIKIVLQTLL